MPEKIYSSARKIVFASDDLGFEEKNLLVSFFIGRVCYGVSPFFFTVSTCASTGAYVRWIKECARTSKEILMRGETVDSRTTHNRKNSASVYFDYLIGTLASNIRTHDTNYKHSFSFDISHSSQ